MAPSRIEDKVYQSLRDQIDFEEDHIPLPTPHWQNNLEVASQSDGDWILFNVENHAEHVLLGEDRDRFIFDLEEVR